MQQLRTGFTKMWKIIPRELKRMNIPPPGSFDKNNAHGGVMWGWPRECNMTDKKALKVMMLLYESKKVTANQLKNVRKTLSYAYELRGGVCKKNWPSLKGIFQNTFDLTTLPKGRACHSTKPTKIPTAEQLKRAFSKPWDASCGMSLVKWTVAYVCAYDWAVFGCRSQEDMGRIKKSGRHLLNTSERWQATEFVGGRCKLCGDKKGTRQWWVWRVCLCPGQHHISPPRDFGRTIDIRGNPTVEVRWNTSCPIACFEFYTSMLNPMDIRSYPRWDERGFWAHDSIESPVEFALWWFEAQGEKPYDGGRFSSNAGRKALARWCHKLNVPYKESFEIHGDLFVTWKDHYEEYVPKGEIEKRGQSKNPDVTTKALGRFAHWLGRGKQVKPKLSRHERYLHHMFREQFGKDKAHRVAHGLPSEDEEE